MEQDKKRLLEALERSLGVVTTACKQAQIGRTTHYRWMQEDPVYKEEVLDLKNVAIDFAESKLHAQIADGNVTATIFYLKTQGKGRGYIETQDITTAGKALTEPTWWDNSLGESDEA